MAFGTTLHRTFKLSTITRSRLRSAEVLEDLREAVGSKTKSDGTENDEPNDASVEGIAEAINPAFARRGQ